VLAHFKRDNSWLDFIADRPGHDRRYAIDSRKIRKELGWKPKHSFDQAFKKTLEWYIDNQDWVRKVQRRTGVFNAHIDLWEAHMRKQPKNR
jgi:dTDP-glucose 4,6-dehydratase